MIFKEHDLDKRNISVTDYGMKISKYCKRKAL